MILETERLVLRELTSSDRYDLSLILQDKDVMYAYEHAFSDEEVDIWLNNQFRRYKEDGFGLWAVLLKKTGEFIGQCGLTKQEIGNEKVVEVGYLFNKKYWHKGYAIESAIACKNYAFTMLNVSEVYSIIRENNMPSINVAKRNGMTIKGKLIKHYYGMDMPHLIFSIDNIAYNSRK